MRLQICLRKTDDVKRELKWKTDAVAAAAAAAASSSSCGTTEVVDLHQQNVVRSCISRLRRGSDLKSTMTTTRLPIATRCTAAALHAKPSSVEEEREEQTLSQGGGSTVTNRADDVMAACDGYELQNNVTPMTSSTGGAPKDAEWHETEMERRRQRVLEMLNTSEGRRMVRQMFLLRDELKQELASLAQRLRNIDNHIETLLQAGSS